MKFIAALLSLSLFIGPVASAEAGREFVMSCTYGTLAGTLVGAATLAFTKRPGDNLNQVARGASLGLYTGILLGAYVALIVPRLGRGSVGDDEVGVVAPFNVWPIVADGRVDGVQADLRLLQF